MSELKARQLVTVMHSPLSTEKFASRVAAAALVLLWGVSWTALDPCVAQEQSRPVVLQGFAEQHADRMAPVAPQLQAGSIFNADAIPKVEPNNDWYWIPAWYAGMKHVDYETIVQDYNFQTGQSVQPNRVVTNRQDLSIGFQPDRNGQIWEYKRAPYTTNVQGDQYDTTMLVRNRDPLRVTKDCVVLRLVQTSVNVDRRSRKIVKTMQEEQINTYTPGAVPGQMNMQTSIKIFGADGMPELQELSTRVVNTTAPFQPVDNYQGRDMRLLFRNFLLTHGFSNYLPDSLKSPQDQAQQVPDQALPTNDQGLPQTGSN